MHRAAVLLEGMALFSTDLALTILMYYCLTTYAALVNTNFVKPSEPSNVSCTFQPCLTLNEYANEADRYFVDNTTFLFMPGVHWLDKSIHLEYVSNLVFQVAGEEQKFNSSDTRVELQLSPLVNITWTNCDGVEVHGLDIFLSGIQPNSNFFATLIFHQTVALLSNLTVIGNSSLISTAILVEKSSQAVIRHLTVHGATSTSGAALYAVESVVKFLGQNVFIDNKATESGGALALIRCESNFAGSGVFEMNSAIGEGGALYMIGGTHSVSGTTFIKNDAYNGGAIAIANDTDSNITFDSVSFVSNTANYGGGAMYLDRGKHNIQGNFNFVNNSCEYGGAMYSLNCTNNISATITFVNNVADLGGALYFIGVNKILNVLHGNMTFESNRATLSGGAILFGSLLDSGTFILLGDIKFINNQALSEGGAIFILYSVVSIVGSAGFLHNKATAGGAIEAEDSIINLEGEVVFESNSARGSGGAIHVIGGAVNVTGTNLYLNNFASLGGALAFSHLTDATSNLILTKPLQMNFTKNHASENGGAIFVSDVISIDECQKTTYDKPDCFVHFIEYSRNISLRLIFINNTAERAGRIMYGGALDKCKLYIGGGEVDECGHRTGGRYNSNPTETLLNISEIYSIDEKLDIASEPHQICLCDPHNKAVAIQCEDQHIKDLTHGKELTLHVIIVGQNQGFVPSAVRVAHSNDVEVTAEQTIQNTTIECTTIKYRPYSESNETTLILFPDDSPCRDFKMSRRVIKVTFNDCPDGFDFSVREKKCSCENRLQKYTENCTIDDRSIQRSASDTFWMGTLFDNGTYRGLILHPNCPLDYCADYPVSITLDDLDIQCNHNHSGILCGSCTRGNSIAFGTLHCLQCSNQYLALMLPFALAGVALVAVLLLLNISVATGAINALIFYANIIQVNRSIFLPLDKVNILTVFVAWINLDLGIETCFYDGMTVYAFTWLQFLFPFYVWFLIGSIIVVTHFSQRATQLLGHNPVAALGTLFLLSYSKILRTIIMALSITHLDYPDDTRKWVWLYNASVPYFEGAAHTTLSLFSIVVLLLLFLPYTLLLTCGHWLQAHSDWKVLSWLNKIKPFMDAYHAPYKKGTRYWTGFLLLVRCVLFLTFALNAFGDENVNLLAITTATVVLLAIASLHGGIYESTFVNVLEISFIVNLCLFSAATYHVKQTTSEGKQAPWLAYTFVGVAFIAFIVIGALSHLSNCKQDTSR